MTELANICEKIMFDMAKGLVTTKSVSYPLKNVDEYLTKLVNDKIALPDGSFKDGLIVKVNGKQIESTNQLRNAFNISPVEPLATLAQTLRDSLRSLQEKLINYKTKKSRETAALN